MNGKETRVKWTTGLSFAEAGCDFKWDDERYFFDGKSATPPAFSEAHARKGKDIPELALGTMFWFGSERGLVEPLRDAGYTFERINNDDKYHLIDASNVEWFAYDY